MKALKSIFHLSQIMWFTIWCRAFSFLLTILQILLICSSNFSSESKVIPSNFSLRVDAIDAFTKWICLCIFEIKRTWFNMWLNLWFIQHVSLMNPSKFVKSNAKQICDEKNFAHFFFFFNFLQRIINNFCDINFVNLFIFEFFAVIVFATL